MTSIVEPSTTITTAAKKRGIDQVDDAVVNIDKDRKKDDDDEKAELLKMLDMRLSNWTHYYFMEYMPWKTPSQHLREWGFSESNLNQIHHYWHLQDKQLIALFTLVQNLAKQGKAWLDRSKPTAMPCFYLDCDSAELISICKDIAVERAEFKGKAVIRVECLRPIPTASASKQEIAKFKRKIGAVLRKQSGGLYGLHKF